MMATIVEKNLIATELMTMTQEARIIFRVVFTESDLVQVANMDARSSRDQI